jgi:Flp pilus assembly CpaF family ATPase
MLERWLKMTRYEELESKLQDVKEPKKSFILSLLKDYVWLEEQIEELRKYPRYLINPKDPKQQKKLEVHNMLKDYQAQKNDIATKILRSLDGEIDEESPLLKALARFSK